MKIDNITSLVRLAQKGDEEAFYTLFTEFQGIIYRIAFVYVKNKEDALDIVQETAYRSFKSIRSVKDEDIHLKLTLDDVLNKLTVHEKTIVMMRYYEELTFKEISKILDIPLGTTKTILYKALQRMRNILVEG